MCGGLGSPVVYYTASPGSYAPVLTAGFTIEFRSFTCNGSGICSPTSFPGGIALGVKHYIVIQKKADSPCGPFTLTI